MSRFGRLKGHRELLLGALALQIFIGFLAASRGELRAANEQS